MKSDFLLAPRQEGTWEDKLPQVKATMKFMKEYVIVHFDYEESLQREINYPHYEEHRKIHEDFKNEVRKSSEQLASADYPEDLVQEVAGKLLAWLINHVTVTDLKIAAFMTEGKNNENSM